MKTKNILLVCAIFFGIMGAVDAQVSGTISIGGDLTKYYPVTFSDSTAWFNNVTTELQIGRSDIHRDASQRGSVIAKFRYHTTNWGHLSNFIDADIRQIGSASPLFIAGWRDATVANSTRRIIIWLRGGSTTYSYTSNYPVNPVVYDGVQNPLPFNEIGGPSHSYKTTFDPYVNTAGMSYNNAAYFNGTTPSYFSGNLGVGTDTTSARLHVEAPQGTTMARFSQPGIPGTEASLNISNGTGGAGLFFPSITGRSKAPGFPYGLFIVGESEDAVPAVNYTNFACVVIDGRNKTGTALTNNNVLAVNSYGQNLFMVKGNGSVGIGTQDTKGYKLAVNGSAIFTRAKVEAYANWPDYVFDSKYSLMPLVMLEKYINENKHLPDMPSADEVAKDGFDLGEMNEKLLQKVEELTLHIIQQQKEIDELKNQISQPGR